MPKPTLDDWNNPAILSYIRRDVVTTLRTLCLKAVELKKAGSSDMHTALTSMSTIMKVVLSNNSHVVRTKEDFTCKPICDYIRSDILDYLWEVMIKSKQLNAYYDSGDSSMNVAISQFVVLLDDEIDVTPALTGLALSTAGDATSVTVGGHLRVIANPVPSAAQLGTVTFKTDHPDIATIANGVLTGVKAGSFKVIATSGSLTKELALTVQAAAPALTGYTVAPKSVAVGATVTMVATPVPAGAQAGAGVHWTSATPAKATIIEGTGVATGVAAGTSEITFTDTAGKTGHGTLTVTAAASPAPASDSETDAPAEEVTIQLDVPSKKELKKQIKAVKKKIDNAKSQKTIDKHTDTLIALEEQLEELSND